MENLKYSHMLKAKKFKSIICLLPKKTSQFVLIIFLVLFIGLLFETDFAIGRLPDAIGVVQRTVLAIAEENAHRTAQR